MRPRHPDPVTLWAGWSVALVVVGLALLSVLVART